jgi:hypothetical protein
VADVEAEQNRCGLERSPLLIDPQDGPSGGPGQMLKRRGGSCFLSFSLDIAVQFPIPLLSDVNEQSNSDALIERVRMRATAHTNP